MKPTVRALAQYLGQTEANLHYKKKHHPKLWALLWSGWLKHNAEMNKERD